ncbi:MAG: PAS domain S-box protein [Rhizobiaceae bacterium]|nr:PAS domain S-box protein [Rhizobiaceae bacterium]
MTIYPFVDIAVLEPVRRSFAAGDALVVTTPDLVHVIWANGGGLELFGLGALDEALSGVSALDEVQRRQLRSVAAKDGHDAVLHMRFADGPQTVLLPVHIRLISLPGGEDGVLLRVPLDAMNPRGAGRDTLDVIEDAGSHAALLKTGARFVARSQRFASIDVDPDDLARMIGEAQAEGDRLVKRPVQTSRGMLPAALARLTDDDGLHLFVVLDPADDDTADTKADIDGDGQPETEPASIGDPIATSEPAMAVSQDAAQRETDLAGGANHHSPLLPDGDEGDIGMMSAPAVMDDAPAVAEDAAPTAEDASPPAELRFAWRTDAEGRFTTLSEALLAALGLAPDAVTGLGLDDIIARHGLVDTGGVASALAGRAMWSGRTLLWPVGDGSEAVQLELAGLPTFSRERAFEGFRGFGIARFRDLQPMAAVGPEETAAGIDDPAPAPTFGRRGQDDNTAPANSHARPGLEPTEAEAFVEIGERLRAGLSAPAGNDNAAAADTALSTADDAELPSAATAPRLSDNDLASPVPALPLPALPVPALPESIGIGGPAIAEGRGPQAVPEGLIPDQPEQDAPPPSSQEERADHAEPNPFVARLPLPVLIYSASGLHFANPEFLALSGHADLEALRAAGGLEALFGEDTGSDAADMRGMRLRHADGRMIDINAHLQSVPWNGGKALMLAIAPRRIAEPSPSLDPALITTASLEPTPELDAAQRQIEELTAILDTATDGVVVLELDGTIRSLNNAAEALFGYDEFEVQGEPFHTLLAIESHRAARDYLSGLTDNGVASVLNDGREMIGREREGRFVPIFVTIGRLASSDGFCAVIRDLTTFKRAEEELNSAKRAAESASSNKSDFVARISHEIRTPLNAIIGFSELMMKEQFGPLANDRYKTYAADIHSSGTLVLQLVNDLLDISRLEAGALAMEFRSLNLNGLTAEALAMLHPQAARARVLLRSSLTEPLPNIVADERSLKQIILNLVSNAIRFTDAGGQVIVSTTQDPDGSVTLRVRDTGIGMDETALGEALKPYRQTGLRPDRESSGTGLGLPIARALAESNKAEFRIHSTPGLGTVVEIAFPATRVLAG